MLKKIFMVATATVLALGAVTVNAADVAQPPYTVSDEMTRKECGDCHMTFPPSRLTKAAWTKIMDDLSNHFGDDATLDAKKVDHIKAYLLSEALDRKNDIRTKMRLKAWAKKGIVDPIRIVDTPEWIGEHKSNRFRTMQQDVGFMGSNCSKCHLNGERGQYESFKDRYPD